jgi:hypothetical protein
MSRYVLMQDDRIQIEPYGMWATFNAAWFLGHHARVFRTRYAAERARHRYGHGAQRSIHVLRVWPDASQRPRAHTRADRWIHSSPTLNCPPSTTL